ncbi:hypothetical protein OUZ56_029339 [Daphnia magna]|uniref:Uncharacterized protein n=1 Tax=Daphnia magna TaxID=35525 RepID=A0ABR0B6J2_9CRUS|nr:hypothetical protein OUZ56_029339 [Daphnia magna]
MAVATPVFYYSGFSHRSFNCKSGKSLRKQLATLESTGAICIDHFLLVQCVERCESSVWRQLVPYVHLLDIVC